MPTPVDRLSISGTAASAAKTAKTAARPPPVARAPITGLATRPPTTVASAPSMPATTMITAARIDLFQGRWWELGSAVGAMFFLVLALNIFGDRLRDALDPKLRNV